MEGNPSHETGSGSRDTGSGSKGGWVMSGVGFSDEEGCPEGMQTSPTSKGGRSFHSSFHSCSRGRSETAAKWKGSKQAAANSPASARTWSAPSS
jgi:hypothetical protein